MTSPLLERIELDPRVCNGKPVIKGTRIPVTVILEQLAEGESWDKILEGYPELTREDIHAAIYYARVSLDHTEMKAVNA
ncbi:MAG: DUF433 domain-containing protein [Thermodesulfovibrionales bacterium]|nr:DUF433 domain-containing protein [Thermodesulfovibrionales bacterium]